MKKAVFVDIDGTLVDEQKNIAPKTRCLLQKAKEKGIEVVICTGRHRISAQTFREKAPLSRYLISANGAEIYDCEAKEVLFQSHLDKEICHKFYQMALEKDMIIKLNFGYGRAINQGEYKDTYEIELHEEISAFLSKNEITQIAMCSESQEKIVQVKHNAAQMPNVILTNEFIWETKGKRFYCVHCSNQNVSKGNAMAGLCKFLQIDLKQVVAIGDGINDISMLKMAGLGVAMRNAPENVKNSADLVTSSNEEEGVSQVLEKILEEEI